MLLSGGRRDQVIYMIVIFGLLSTNAMHAPMMIPGCPSLCFCYIRFLRHVITVSFVLNSLGHPLLTILSSGGFSDSSSMLALLRIRIMSEDLLRKVEDGKWAKNTSRCTNSDDCLPQKSALSHPPHLQELTKYQPIIIVTKPNPPAILK
jgi:hypothetical protein